MPVAEHVPTLDELRADPALAAGLSESARLRLLAAAAGIAAVLRIGAAAAGPPPPSGPRPNGDELWTVDEVGAWLKKPRHAVYSMLRTKAIAPAVVRINRRTLRVRKEVLMRLLPRN
jgi:hypothetical protein